MISLPKNYFTPAQREAMPCAWPAGVFWTFGDFWLAHGSPLNPRPGRYVHLLDCYDGPGRLPPTLEEIERMLSVLEMVVVAEEQKNFAVQSAVLRATAREYFAI